MDRVFDMTSSRAIASCSGTVVSTRVPRPSPLSIVSRPPTSSARSRMLVSP